MSALKEIEILVRSKYPILYIVSWEERRIEAALQSIAADLNRKLHVWTLTSEMDVASAHLMIGDDVDGHGVLDQAQHLLRTTHGIAHATLQVEPASHEGCEDLTW